MTTRVTVPGAGSAAAGKVKASSSPPLIALHVAAALFHLFVLKDATLKQMV